ncbi:hypothetical protein NDU88_003820 [Pleurodeles waltl]|uniref:Guanine nucleotide-binding protein subunit gamma n=2 Tax=Pleurodeles waltl TaxID=8319 RepID=A0AAV7MTL0_PLEWA|nr:hypothetical protein NDU88_003820 [Pleurodeles waltl]
MSKYKYNKNIQAAIWLTTKRIASTNTLGVRFGTARTLTEERKFQLWGFGARIFVARDFAGYRVCLLSWHQKMPVINIDDLSDKDKLKMEVEQLKKEMKLKRQLVSKMCEEITLYIEGRSGEDPLVKGVPEDRNPFKEKGSCVVA